MTDKKATWSNYMLDLRDASVEQGSFIEFHKEWTAEKSVYWTEPNLTFLRVRFTGSWREGQYDLGYARGYLNQGTSNEIPVAIRLPDGGCIQFRPGETTPKQILIAWAKADKLYLKDMGFWDALSFSDS